MNEIFFTDKTIKQFRACYEVAKDRQDECFTFEGKEFLVAYAKYLLGYLNSMKAKQ